MTSSPVPFVEINEAHWTLPTTKGEKRSGRWFEWDYEIAYFQYGDLKSDPRDFYIFKGDSTQTFRYDPASTTEMFERICWMIDNLSEMPKIFVCRIPDEPHTIMLRFANDEDFILTILKWKQVEVAK